MIATRRFGTICASGTGVARAGPGVLSGTRNVAGTAGPTLPSWSAALGVSSWRRRMRRSQRTAAKGWWAVACMWCCDLTRRSKNEG